MGPKVADRARVADRLRARKALAVRRRKARGEGPDRRREIVAAARELMIRDGYDNTSMRTIARRVGVSPTALYVYFPDKEALFFEVCHEAFMPLLAQTMALMAEDGDVLDRVRRGFVAYLRWGLEHPEEYSLIFLSRKVGLAPYDHRQPLLTAGPTGEPRYNSFAILVDAIKQLMSAKLIVEDDSYLIAELAWMACHGLVAAYIARPNAPFAPQDRLVEGMVDLVIGGLQARKQAATPLLSGGESRS
jgi:AcrR family transcriptional regulator